MRISTLGFSMGSLSAMMTQQSALAKVQNQLALGSRVTTPSDDPIAFVHIQELQRAQSESEQFAKNATLAKNRLSLEEQAFVDTSSVMSRVRDLMISAGNTATMSDTDRQSVATELAARLDELQAIANRQDGNGEFLFSGYSTKTEPFSGGDGTPINYVADQGARQLQISSTQRIADSHNGFEVFVNIPQGNGTFATAVNMSNSGSGGIDIGSVVDRPSWVPDDYTITFTSPTAYEITDGATPANVVQTGAYTAGSAITFNGVSVTITGAPATGDTFEVNRSRNESIFDTIGDVVDLLNTPAGNATANAKLTSTLQGVAAADGSGDRSFPRGPGPGRRAARDARFRRGLARGHGYRPEEHVVGSEGSRLRRRHHQDEPATGRPAGGATVLQQDLQPVAVQLLALIHKRRRFARRLTLRAPL